MSAGPSVLSSSADTLRQAFDVIRRLDGKSADAEPLRELHNLCPAADDWARLLSSMSLDKASFGLRVGESRANVIHALSGWCRNFKTSQVGGRTKNQAAVYGYLAVLLITLITMEESQPGLAAGHDCRETCQRLVRDADVRAALHSLYAPMSGDRRSGGHCDQEWTQIADAELEFHRHGSTSFILHGKAPQIKGRRLSFALKCVLLPYASIPAIAEATRNYENDHNSLDVDGRQVENMVHVWASTGRWILMDFVEGRTLAEEIEEIKNDPVERPITWGRRRVVSPANNVRLDLLRRLGPPLLSALGQLHAQGKRHDDLSPSNIIVTRQEPGDSGPEYRVKFVDFGRNYLYIGVVGAVDRPDAVFVAPEVRENARDVPYADLYSLGRILIALGDVGENGDGTVPDRFYGQAPLIARLIEDLIEQRPEYRLLVFRPAPDEKNVYLALRDVLVQELDVTQGELVKDQAQRGRAIPDSRQSLVAMVTSVFPPSREQKKRRRVYRIRKEQNVLSDPRRSMYARWLLIFSVIASIDYYITAGVCIYWFLRDIGIDILNPADEIFLRLIGARSDFIPLIDSLRRPDYHLGQVWTNLPARVVCLSFSLAKVRYYHNIIGGLTTRVADSPELPGAGLRVTAEFIMRTMALYSSWLILGANLVDVHWWPLASALGYTGALAVDTFSSWFIVVYLKRAREQKLSTVPAKHQKVTGFDAYLQWVPSMAFCTVVVWVVGFGIYRGWFHDTVVYVAVVVLINIGLIYVIKTGTNALDIRTGLTRCFLAAERLRYEADDRAGLRSSTHSPSRPTLISTG